MCPEQQSPAGQGGASREMLAGPSLDNSTAPDWRTQLIARRHRLSHTIAGLIRAEAFGETAHEG